MADMIDRVKAECGEVLTPIMITCDPARDTPAVLRPYIKEFHPDLIGLTGDWESIKATCKEYRVYFSTPPNVKPGQDYLVDHSIYFYLMGESALICILAWRMYANNFVLSDPEGDFVEAIGRNFTAEQASKVIRDHVNDWTGPLDRKPRKID
jgi:protein SCO1/2